MTTILLVFALVVAFAIAVIAAIAFVALKPRAQGMEESAQRLGLSYQGEASQSLITELRDLPLFARTASHRGGQISNAMTGKLNGVAVTAFDYAYAIDSGNAKHFDYAQTVVCFHLASGGYPLFALHASEHVTLSRAVNFADESPELKKFGGKIVTKSVGTTITKSFVPGDENLKVFEEMLDPQQRDLLEAAASRRSSNAHSMTEDERAAAVRRFEDLSREPLLQYESHRLSVECTGRWLAIFRMNTLVAPQKMPAFLTHCVELQRALSARLNKAAEEVHS